MWPVLFPLLALLPANSLAAATSSSNSQGITPESRILHVKTCPLPCNKVGDSYQNWSHFPSLEDLAVCPEPVLLAFNILAPPTSIRACTLGDGSTETNYLAKVGYVSPEAKGVTNFGPGGLLSRALKNTTISDGVACGADKPRKARVNVKLSEWDSGDVRSDSAMRTTAADANDNANADVVRAIKALEARVSKDESCDKFIQLAYVRGTLVGVYSGSLIEKAKTSAALMGKLADKAKSSSASAIGVALEVCGKDRSSASTFGVIADASGDLSAVQRAMNSWSNGECLEDSDEVKGNQVDTEMDLWSFDLEFPADDTDGSGLMKRDDCRTIRIEQNDDCSKLASRCGIGNTAFKSFNKDLCDKILRPGRPVCCSSGSLPDLRPQPDGDGYCAKHNVAANEGCAVIAAIYGLEEEQLDDMNRETWGWDGCEGGLLLGQVLCVSYGDPPMPATYPDAICGPTKPGTERPPLMFADRLAKLNPCPLNVCCNVWGKCGTTADFCTVSRTNTGNPGTSRPGENGCQSSCGKKIVNDFEGPSQFRKIAYYEGWNYKRPCLNMNVLDIDRSYTHVHFAFAEISADMQVVIPQESMKQWKNFVSAQNFPKKILAFGGWAFSNEGEGAGRLREAVSTTNRHEFSTRVVQFALENDLDGLDFDWEYPGATDIIGSPDGNDEDGPAYLAFLTLVRAKLPRHMSLSMAAPSSYWYLRGFPIEKMAFELDYIVYMTYDFHGQWDVGNKWAQPGCPGGNCLRSHINATTTHESFVMITKAGVPTHKIVVGVSSYGRSFKMADSTCRGPQCTFLGERNKSPAKPGRCTDTGGYVSNFEIEEIIKKGGAIKTWWDEETDSDYLVYSQVEWVAYMTNTTKTRRTEEYRQLNMGGTSDWAVDLQAEGKLGEDDIGESDYVPDPNDDKPLAPCVYTPTTMDEINNLHFRNEILPHCAAGYIISVMHASYRNVQEQFDSIMKDGYDKYFAIYADHIFKSSRDALWNFMMENSNKYFNCEISSKYGCCRSCDKVTLINKCKNCIDDCEVTGPTYDGWEWRTKKQACPPDFSGRGYDANRYHMESISWDFKDEDAKKSFFNDVLEAVGVEEKYLTFPEHATHHKATLAYDNCYGYPPSPTGLPGYDDLPDGACKAEHWWHYGPQISSSFTVAQVPNPKDDVNKILSTVDIDAALSEIELGILADEYDEDSSELVEALILPIFMMSGGLEHMKTVVEMAKEIEESERISLIMNLVTALLLLVGGFGGVLAGTGGSAALRIMGQAMVVTAEAGNTAVGIYTAVESPNTIPLLVFGLVMSASGLRSATNVHKAAYYTKNMPTADIAKTNPYAGRMAGIARTTNTKGPINYCRWG